MAEEAVHRCRGVVRCIGAQVHRCTGAELQNCRIAELQKKCRCFGTEVLKLKSAAKVQV